uniref:Rx N-terminal domain-containing protein n=1 Tax=Fagus sylvatica TaxID=28930 RepID=A0A2N9GBW2_FAGSY
MAESVVSGVVSRLGDLLLQEANFLYDEESELVRQWVAEIREVAYDADDIIGTYALKVASRRQGGGGIQKEAILVLRMRGNEEQRQTYSHLGHDVVGFEDDLNKLVAFLLKEEESNRVNVASICGMGGLGKTTLAKMVYNHDKVKQHFELPRLGIYLSTMSKKKCLGRNSV